MNKAIFLDRDGTINVDKEYIYKVEDFEFEEGAVKGLKILQSLGYQLIIITGQSGIGRGYYSEEDYHKFMDHMHLQLARHNLLIDGEYFRSHHPEKGIGKYKIDCNCRKPKPGMICTAIAEYNINKENSWMIGDSLTDIAVGKNAGINTAFIYSGGGSGSKNEKNYKTIKPNITCYDLLDAVKKIIE